MPITFQWPIRFQSDVDMSGSPAVIPPSMFFLDRDWPYVAKGKHLVGLSELDGIECLRAAPVIVYDAADIYRKLSADGLQPGVLKDGGIHLENVKRTLLVIHSGLIQRNRTMIDRALKGYETAIQYQGPAGDFPMQIGTGLARNIHHKSIGFLALLRTVAILLEADIPEFNARVQALLARATLTANWMATSPDARQILVEGNAGNQLMCVVACMFQAARLLDDSALMSTARGFLSIAMSRVYRGDGAVTEKGGLDASYLTVSLEMMVNIIRNMPDADREDFRPVLLRSVNKFLGLIGRDGTLDMSDNTRTEITSFVPGPGPKGLNIDVIPLRLYDIGFLYGENKIERIGDLVMLRGQSPDHTED